MRMLDTATAFLQHDFEWQGPTDREIEGDNRKTKRKEQRLGVEGRRNKVQGAEE